MTDPAKLAEDADACAARVEASRLDGTEFVMLSLTAQESRMIAAALRLADKIDRANRGLMNGKPGRMYGKAGDPEGEAMLTAYRRAKEEA